MIDAEENKNLFAEAKKLPRQPGCYLFKDAEGNVLYAGKSKCLNKRVTSYFGKQKDEKFYMMMRFVTDIEHRCKLG